MINLSTNVSQANITKWKIVKFDPETGVGEIEFQANSGQSQRVPFALSNEVNRSMGIRVNPSPTGWNDKIVPTTSPTVLGGSGVGVANSLLNAQNAYENAGGGHNNRLKAVELQALTDGWVESPALTGT